MVFSHSTVVWIVWRENVSKMSRTPFSECLSSQDVVSGGQQNISRPFPKPIRVARWPFSAMVHGGARGR
jgi:hypothetical protein